MRETLAVSQNSNFTILEGLMKYWLILLSIVKTNKQRNKCTNLIQTRELKNSASIDSKSFNINFLFNILL
mgnify:CR=1 FL=1